MLFGFSSSYAETKSALGLNYLDITRNDFLAGLMFEIEPKLIAHYETTEFGRSKRVQEIGMRGLGLSLRSDSVTKSWIAFFKKAYPELPLRFLELDKSKYPNLWDYGELVRLEIEVEKSKKLYRTLHGNDYDGWYFDKTNKYSKI